MAVSGGGVSAPECVRALPGGYQARSGGPDLTCQQCSKGTHTQSACPAPLRRPSLLRASPQDGAAAPDGSPPLFCTWDFYLHDSQATAPAPGPRPAWGTTVQYVVEAGALLGEYLGGHTMQVRPPQI